MARGSSGRIVIDVDPEFKKRVYVALAERQMTMKQWFVMASEALLRRGGRGKRSSRMRGGKEGKR